MAEFIRAASIKEIPSGSMKTIQLRGINIAVANVDGEFFAISDTCSHEECSLGGEGFLDGNVVICGCHGAQFDITNGHVLSLPATQPVTSYTVKIQETDIYIEI